MEAISNFRLMVLCTVQNKPATQHYVNVSTFSGILAPTLASDIRMFCLSKRMLLTSPCSPTKTVIAINSRV